MKRFMLSLLILAAIVPFAAVSASAASEVIVPAFGSGSAPTSVVQENLPSNNASSYAFQSELTSSFGGTLGYASSFSSVPAAVYMYGNKNNGHMLGTQWSAKYPNIRNTARWDFLLDDYNFQAGRAYRLSIGEFKAYTEKLDAYQGMANFVVVKAVLYDSQGVEIVFNEWTLDWNSSDVTEVLAGTVGRASHVYLFSWSSDIVDDFYFAFPLPENVNISGFVLSFEVSIVAATTYTGVGGVGIQNLSPWFGFSDVVVVRDLSAEEEWQDEQRGFWQKVLDFLQGIWDAIKAIPEAIANFFKQIWDVLRMIFEWIATIGRLLVKSAQVLGAVIGGLPIWMSAGALALVAVCVIYKILGRENQS